MKELFRASRDSLGSRTLMRNLREEGFAIGRDRTRRLMKALNLKVKRKRKYKATTDSKHNLPVAENVLNRQFGPQGPNQAWGTDITYLWTREGWVYLAVVIDLYSRRLPMNVNGRENGAGSNDRRPETCWSDCATSSTTSCASWRWRVFPSPTIRVRTICA
jgi:HTH-like domain/Integrase core domain